jgi:hypothetical protein
MSEYERLQISITARLLLIFRHHLHQFVHTISRTRKRQSYACFLNGWKRCASVQRHAWQKDKDPRLRFYLISEGKDIQPRSFTREVPSVRTIHGILYTISSNLIEIYNGINVTSLKAKRIDLLLIKLVKDSVLIVGR